MSDVKPYSETEIAGIRTGHPHAAPLTRAGFLATVDALRAEGEEQRKTIDGLIEQYECDIEVRLPIARAKARTEAFEEAARYFEEERWLTYRGAAPSATRPVDPQEVAKMLRSLSAKETP